MICMNEFVYIPTFLISVCLCACTRVPMRGLILSSYGLYILELGVQIDAFEYMMLKYTCTHA